MSCLQEILLSLKLCEIVKEDCIEDKMEDKEGGAGRGKYYDVLREILMMVIGDLGIIEGSVKVKEDRENKVDFAIRKNKKEKYKIILEFKRPSKLIGAIYYDSSKSKVILKKSRAGALEDYERWKRNEKQYPAKQDDWVGQLRGYFLSMNEENKLEKDSFSILTNGLLWVIFRFNPEREVTAPVDESEIVSSFILPEDYEKLKDKMKEFLM